MGNTQFRAKRSYLRFAIGRSIVIFLALLLLVGVLLGLLYRMNDINNHAIIETKEIHYLSFQVDTILRDFGEVIPDLFFLSSSDLMADALGNSSSGARQSLAADFSNFLKIKSLYDRVSLLDTSGKEIVRVNYNLGQTAAAPEEALQSKADLDYVQDMLSLNKGEVYVSRFELDTEKGDIVRPLKPTIQFGTPMLDRSGKKQGILILSYMGQNMLNDMVKGPGGRDHVMLLDPNGYYLLGLKQEDTWGFMLPDRSQRTFGADFPEAWASIRNGLTGQFYTSEGLFTFDTVFPMLDSQKPRSGVPISLIPSPGLEKSAVANTWKIVLFIPSAALATLTNAVIPDYVRLFLILTLVAAAGSIVLTIAVVRRQRAEDNLIASEARFRAVAETANDAIVVSNSEGRIVLWNPAAEAMFGYPAPEAAGMPLANLIPERLRQENEGDVESMLTGKNAQITGSIIEQTATRKDELEFPAEMTFAHWQTNEGLFHTAIIRNITERRRLEVLEAEVAARDREIVHIAESEFLASIAEEIRTPLNTIIGFSEVIQGEYFGKLNAKQAEHTRNILISSLHLQELINEMGDLRRVEKSRLELDLTPVRIGELLRTSLAIMQEKALSKHITLKIQISPELDDLEILADNGKLKQVLFNLLSNAIKFTPDGGNVVFEASNNDQEVIASVSDTGIGIPLEEQSRIFGKFYQIYDAQGKLATGPGLGLTLAKNYIELHGGRIWVESDGMGKGSSFIFTLPIKR